MTTAVDKNRLQGEVIVDDKKLIEFGNSYVFYEIKDNDLYVHIQELDDKNVIQKDVKLYIKKPC